VHGRLVVAHGLGALACVDRVDGGARHALLHGERLVQHPLERVVHVARGHQDRELHQLLRDRIPEPQVFAHALHAVQQLGTPQQRDERPDHGLAGTGDERFGRLPLRIAHRLHFHRGQPVLHRSSMGQAAYAVAVLSYA
jgi:hypothetical protein